MEPNSPQETQETPQTAPQPEIEPLLVRPEPFEALPMPKTMLALGAASLSALVVVSVIAFREYVTFAATPETQTAAAAESVAPDPFGDISIQARGAFVLDLATETVLFESNADAQLPLASITKVPLALATAEVLDPEGRTTVSAAAVARGEELKLAAGETWRIRDLFDVTLVASSNIGAEALAEAADAPLRTLYPQAPQGGAAVWRMNQLVKDLGLSKTYFLNPSGLDVSETQPSAMGSAREVALLFAYAARSEADLFAETTKRELWLGPVGGVPRTIPNTNDALLSIPGLVVGKTGFTDLAGGNLAIVFEAGPARPVAIVVLGSTESGRFDDMRALVAAAQTAISGGETGPGVQ